MTSILEGAKRLVTRGGTDIGTRVAGLQDAVDGARGRLDDELVEEAQAVVDRVAGRLRLSADHTVVALAGATGSGKSSTFNALTGLEVSAVGVRRPTTSWATACVWGAKDADEVLDWLGIPPRHQVTRDSMLDKSHKEQQLDGVVLLDLPDHDSTEVAHHLEVDRLVKLADLFVWVLDPQKYADAAIHERYFAPLATHKDVMLVVLNHIDSVAPERREAMLDDIRRLIAKDGLDGVPVLGVSAKQGWGIPLLKEEIARRAAEKKTTRDRLTADVKATATTLQAASGNARARTVPDDRLAALDDALADSAGVPTVVAAVEDATRMRATRATGWPVVAWVSAMRPDPLKRLHLDLGQEGRQLTGVARTSLPESTQVQRARVDTQVRSLTDEVTTGLTRPWAAAVRKASVSRLPDLNDRLDAALGATDLGTDKLPGWTGVVRFLQWVLILAALAGAAWFALLLAVPSLPETPALWGVPVPIVLLIGGLVLGILLGLVCRFLVNATARSRAATADKRLRSAIHEVSTELVAAPVAEELAAYAKTRDGLDTALK